MVQIGDVVHVTLTNHPAVVIERTPTGYRVRETTRKAEYPVQVQDIKEYN